MTTNTPQSTAHATYDAMIEEATKQPGVFEVMQVMGRVAQYRQTLDALQTPPAMRFTVSSSSLAQSPIYRAHA